MQNRKLLAKAKLYLILDTQVNSYKSIFEITKQVIGEGVDIIQIRDKQGNAKQILAFVKKVIPLVKDRVLLIINDRADLTFVSKANGVHLGQEDLSISMAKKVLGPNDIKGVSCQTMSHVIQAQARGADYIGFGSIFKTMTKPHRTSMDLRLLEAVLKVSKIPMFGIGGINLENVRSVLDLGMRRVAVCRAVCGDPNPNKVVRSFRKILDSYAF